MRETSRRGAPSAEAAANPSGGGRRGVVGWLLDRAERERLLERCPPTYPDVVTDHVTLAVGASKRARVPREARREIVGACDDRQGVQALVARIGGTTDRSDGSAYHLTRSLDRSRGRKAARSDGALARVGWRPLPAPVPVTPESAGLLLIPGRAARVP